MNGAKTFLFAPNNLELSAKNPDFLKLCQEDFEPFQTQITRVTKYKGKPRTKVTGVHTMPGLLQKLAKGDTVVIGSFNDFASLDSAAVPALLMDVCEENGFNLVVNGQVFDPKRPTDRLSMIVIFAVNRFRHASKDSIG